MVRLHFCGLEGNGAIIPLSLILEQEMSRFLEVGRFSYWYSLNACVLPPRKFIYWDPSPQCDGIKRWDFEVIRSWGWSPQELDLWQHSEKTGIHESGSRSSPDTQALILNFLAFRPGGNKWFISHHFVVFCYNSLSRSRHISTWGLNS